MKIKQCFVQLNKYMDEEFVIYICYFIIYLLCMNNDINYYYNFFDIN